MIIYIIRHTYNGLYIECTCVHNYVLPSCLIAGFSQCCCVARLSMATAALIDGFSPPMILLSHWIIVGFPGGDLGSVTS